MSAPPPAAPPEATAATAPPGALTIPRAPRVARLKELAFRGGMLACLGIALATLARRLPGLEVDTDVPAWRGLLFRGLERLPVRWPLPS